MGFWIFLVFASLFSGIDHSVRAEIIERPSQLVEAHEALQDAFVTVLEAEQDGVNIEDLLDNLSSAADLLAQAEMSFRNGYIDGAIEEVTEVFSITSEVKTNALNARHLALINGGIDFVASVVFPIMGGFSIVLVLYIVWKWIKEYYLKRLRASKPEVRTVET